MKQTIYIYKHTSSYVYMYIYLTYRIQILSENHSAICKRQKKEIGMYV